MASQVSRTFHRKFSRDIIKPWNFINGKRSEPSDILSVMQVTQPSTGALLCEVPASGSRDVDHAVNVAKDAQKLWKELSPRERGVHLIAAAKIIRENIEDIARLEVIDTGKPIWEARFDVTSCAESLEYIGGVIPAITGQHIPLPGGSFALVSREPLGVVAGIGAWNFPICTCAWKAAPALACGNSFIYKPSQFTPLTAITLGEILTSAGVPDGVYNVLQGDGATGALLSSHPGVAKVSFTGSVPTGIKVMQAGAKSLKAVTLELGGKSPLIIFDDADLKNAVKGAMMANFLTQGEVCSNGTRVFVQKSIMEKFKSLLLKQTQSMKIGDPFSEDVTVGATIHDEHAKKVLSYIDSAKQEGASVLCGGERVMQSGKLAGGWYLSPCILTNCKDSMKVVKEEVFGSVLALMEFETEEEVIARANATDFGLAGGVFTKDIQRGHRVAQGIEAGSVYINTFNFYPPEVPFGGYKHSGVGRENGTAVFDHYSQTKTIYVEMGDVDCGPLYTED